MTSLAGVRNPFDFANPVHGDNRALLAGRDEQLKEITYYIEQLDRASQATSIAILGERASGKTSLLNIAQAVAEDRGLTVARIDLTERDVESEGAFWYKVFDEALHAAVANGALGGLHGQIYSSYLETVHDDAELTEATIFRSPSVFQKVSQNPDASHRIHEGLIKRDLSKLVEATETGLVLLFDECDVLKVNPALLQQFRNVFMNLRGCMLALAATPSLFPSLSETFSPIIRQFKSIQVGPFVDPSDVEACISERLALVRDAKGDDDVDLTELVGWQNRWDLFRFAMEVLRATGGHPHQIQLICHLAFRRFQEGEAPSLEISFEVLDEMINEIGLTESAEQRQLPQAMLELSPQERSELDLLTRCCGKATVGQLALAACIEDPDGGWTAEAAHTRSERLRQRGVLDITDDGVVDFAGDSLDVAYCRLYARRQNEQLAATSLPPDERLASAIAHRISKLQPADGPGFTTHKLSTPSVLDGLTRILAEAEQCDWPVDPPSLAVRRELMFLEELVSRRSGSEDVDPKSSSTGFVLTKAATTWTELSMIVATSDTDLSNLDAQLRGLEREIAEVTGSDCELRVAEVPEIDEEIWLGWIVGLGTDDERKDLHSRFMQRAVSAFREERLKEAIEFAEKALTLDRPVTTLNNTGFLYLADGRHEAAVEILAEAVEVGPADALSGYNLGVALLVSRSKAEAIEQFSRVRGLENGSAFVMMVVDEFHPEVRLRVQADAPPSPATAAAEILEALGVGLE